MICSGLMLRRLGRIEDAIIAQYQGQEHGGYERLLGEESREEEEEHEGGGVVGEESGTASDRNTRV